MEWRAHIETTAAKKENQNNQKYEVSPIFFLPKLKASFVVCRELK